jgi:hypothetical protein
MRAGDINSGSRRKRARGWPMNYLCRAMAWRAR